MRTATLTLILLSFFYLHPAAHSADQSLGEISKTKYYYCIENSYKLALKTISKNGNILRTKIYSKRKARRIYKNFTTEIRKLLKEVKTTKSVKKKGRLRVKIAGRKVIKSGIKKCLNKSLEFASDQNLTSGSLPPETVLPEEINTEKAIESSFFNGSCEYKAKVIEPYATGSDKKILAPLSGQFYCSFTSSKSSFGDLLLKAYKKGAPQEIVFSKTVPRSEIKAGFSFKVSVCDEFPGCYYSNLLAKISSESGIDISLEELQ